MGTIIARNLRTVLGQRKLRFIRPEDTRFGDVTEEDAAIAEEWLAQLPQAVLDDSDKPLVAEGLFAIAAERHGTLTLADISALKQAAYTLMIDRTYDALSTWTQRKSRQRRTSGLR